MELYDIKKFLEKENWIISIPRPGITRYTSPGRFNIVPPLYFDIPDEYNTVDEKIFTDRILEILAKLYVLPVSDIGHLVKPMINCNTQIFKTENLPPFLFKTVLPFPYYCLFSVRHIMFLYRISFLFERKIRMHKTYTWFRKLLYTAKSWWFRYGRTLNPIIGAMVLLQLFLLFIYPYLNAPFDKILSPLKMFSFVTDRWYGKLLLICFIFLYFDDARRFLFNILKRVRNFLFSFQGNRFKTVTHFLYNAGLFSFVRQQGTLLKMLTSQYPESTGFVIHTIDLEFMKAGKPATGYYQQIDDLVKINNYRDIKASVFPFLFVDPERFNADPEFFTYQVFEGRIVPGDCMVKKLLDGNRPPFMGIKIKPALGYYPFDVRLLPLWKYAADNNIPVYMTCNSDALYYRGLKKKAWDDHPVFSDNDINPYNSNRGHEENYLTRPLFLPQVENSEFTKNFSNPLNYLCLLHEPLLRIVVGRYGDNRIRDIFGYAGEDRPLRYNLSDMKLCFSHFGGAEEWRRFMKYDLDQHSSNEFLRKPNEGIAFFDKYHRVRAAKLSYLWKEADWYSVICSLMLQYPHVYADISHIPGDPGLYPLLKNTLQNPRLKTKVLMGTDFYLNHRRRSERSILAEMSEHLTSEELDLIGRNNPRQFLGVI